MMSLPPLPDKKIGKFLQDGVREICLLKYKVRETHLLVSVVIFNPTSGDPSDREQGECDEELNLSILYPQIVHSIQPATRA